MKITGISLLVIGIILAVVGICLTAGVIVLSIPYATWFTWIPISVGGFLAVIGIVLMVLGK